MGVPVNEPTAARAKANPMRKLHFKAKVSIKRT